MHHIHPTAIIYPNVTIEPNVYIGAFCIIGAPPEHKAKWNKPNKGVIIRSGAVIHGHCTIDAGIDKPTEIKSNAFIMKHVHIGHDAVIYKDAILAPHVCIGGHSQVGEKTNMGMQSTVHQRVSIPNNCMIGMGSVITKKTELWQGGCYVGAPATFLRWNNRN